MRSRWTWIAGYAVIVAAQLALLGGAASLHRLSKQKMMVMRYLFAKNITLEAFWFSPIGRAAQVAALLAASAVFVVAVVAWIRAGKRFPAAQACIAAALAAVTAGLLLWVRPSTAIAVYAVVIVLWVVLAVQLAVTLTAIRLRRSAA